MEHHLRSNVLDHFPQDVWKQLDAPDMIDEPDLGTYVFAKVNGKEEVFVDMGTPDDPNVMSFSSGDSLIVRYERVRELCLAGKVTLM
jgi:hypothetical protein